MTDLLAAGILAQLVSARAQIVNAKDAVKVAEDEYVLSIQDGTAALMDMKKRKLDSCYSSLERLGPHWIY
jgi:uncharacterized protein YrrD